MITKDSFEQLSLVSTNIGQLQAIRSLFSYKDKKYLVELGSNLFGGAECYIIYPGVRKNKSESISVVYSKKGDMSITEESMDTCVNEFLNTIDNES